MSLKDRFHPQLGRHLRRRSLVSLLAGLTTWLTLQSWHGFAERPSGFLAPAFGACLLVAVSGILLRSSRLPLLAVPLVQLAVLAAWLHHGWAGEQAALGWLPTGDSLRAVGDVLRSSALASQTYSSPVPKSVPQFYPILVAAAAATALLVDVLACTLRRVPLAGLPLLAVYTAPVSILGGVGWLTFALAALSFLFLLTADESLRLTEWGQATEDGPATGERAGVLDSGAHQVSTGSLWTSARNIGLTVTALAVVVPLLVPTITLGLFSRGGRGPGGNGDAVSLSNPIVDLRRDLVQGRDVELLRATTTAADPSYLRISVLDTFDGTTWRPSGRAIPLKQRANGLVTRPPGLTASVPQREVPWDISVDDTFRSRWLPTPYPVSSVVAPGDWRYDVNTLDFISAAGGQTTAGLRYRLDALELSPSAAQLSDAGPAPSTVVTPYTELPRSLPASVRTLARRVTAGADTRFAKAVALQEWFRHDGGFSYSLDRAPGTGTKALVQFLRRGPGGRTGYCEQFAAAMALMGRTLGIPSRVAVGFLHPDKVGKDTYSYSTHDLHSWPEMYFQGVGWVRFEPTPASRTGAVPAYTTQPIPSSRPSASAPSRTTAPQQNKLDRPNGPTSGASAGGGAGSGAGRALLVSLGALLVLAVLALAPRTARGWVRRRRWAAVRTRAEAAEAAWAELRDSALDLGLLWDDTVTLRHRARDLVRAFGRHDHELGADRSAVRGVDADPEATRALDRLVRGVEAARFAPPTTSGGDAGSVTEQTDVGVCVRALHAGVSRARRVRATWLPLSLLERFRGDEAARRRTPGRQLGVPEAGVDRAV